MFEIGRVLHPPITMASPNRNNYSYQGLGSYDSGRSRQNSGAMDIHVLTGQEPPREPPPNDDPYDGHGGPDQTSRYTRYFTLSHTVHPTHPAKSLFLVLCKIASILQLPGD